MEPAATTGIVQFKPSDGTISTSVAREQAQKPSSWYTTTAIANVATLQMKMAAELSKAAATILTYPTRKGIPID
jgi:hypothetical protein